MSVQGTDLSSTRGLAALERELERLLELVSDPRSSPERLEAAWAACGGAARLERELAAATRAEREPDAGSLRSSLERLRRLNAIVTDVAGRQRDELERTLELARGALLELRALRPEAPSDGACDVEA